MAVASSAPSPSTARILAAFAAVYVIWGSTYLGIRIGIESIPPYVLAGTRFAASAVLMTAYALWRRAPAPDARDVRTGVLTGLLMLSAGNGTVTWATQFVPSGRIALLVATTPVWMTIFDWARRGGVRPSLGEVAGLLVGLSGVALLIGPDAWTGAATPAALGGQLLALVGACSWAAGSLFTRYSAGRTTAAMRTALQMWVAAVVLTTVAALRGEWQGFVLSQVSLRSWIAWWYLVLFGSLIGFTAYVWLLKVVSPSKAATYAYVNPAVALALGWAIAGEPLSTRTLTASAIIIGGVALVTIAKRPAPPPAPNPHTDESPISEVA